VKALLLVLLALLQSGCWTIYSIGANIPEKAPPVYGGIRSWHACITHYDSSAIMGIYTILDVPFSFVLDTLLLPITVILSVLA